MTRRELQRLARARRYQDGDCVSCGIEPRGEGVLGEACRERNNARRRKGGPAAGSRGHSAELLGSVRDALCTGESRRSIARRFGLSTATIWRWTREAA